MERLRFREIFSMVEKCTRVFPTTSVHPRQVSTQVTISRYSYIDCSYEIVGSALARFERLTLPETSSRAVGLVRILKMITPVKCVIPLAPNLSLHEHTLNYAPANYLHFRVRPCHHGVALQPEGDCSSVQTLYIQTFEKHYKAIKSMGRTGMADTGKKWQTYSLCFNDIFQGHFR